MIMSRDRKPVPYLKPVRQAAVLLAAWFCAASVLADPITIRFSHVVAESAPKGIGAQLFKERAEKALAGKLRVEIYPDSQLYSDDEVITALLMGDVELAAPSLAKFRSVSEQLQVFDLPFLFSDVEAVHRFQATPVGQSLLTAMSRRGLRGLAYWDNGMRVISANKRLLAPQDAQALTFRIEPSNVIEAQYSALAAVVLRLPFSRVFDALDRGLVDGQENTWSNIASKRFHTVQRYFTETNHSYLGYMVVTTDRFWNGLPAEVRSTLQEILAEVSLEVRQIARDKAQEGRALVSDSDSELVSLTPAQRGAWRKVLRPVWQDFEDRIGKEVITAAVAVGESQHSATPR